MTVMLSVNDRGGETKRRVSLFEHPQQLSEPLKDFIELITDEDQTNDFYATLSYGINRKFESGIYGFRTSHLQVHQMSQLAIAILDYLNLVFPREDNQELVIDLKHEHHQEPSCIKWQVLVSLR